MIHERGFFRAPNTDGGGGGGARKSNDQFIFEQVAHNGDAPDVDAVNAALGQLNSLYEVLKVSAVDRTVLIQNLRTRFDDGDRKGQIAAGSHILGLRDLLSEAVNIFRRGLG